MKFKIKELCQIICGGTPSTTNPEYWDGDIVWLTPKDLSINRNKYIVDSSNKITSKGLNNSSTKIVPKGAVLLSSRAPIGYLAISNCELCTNQGFKSLVCNKDLINNEYLYYLLQTKVEELKSISTGSTFLELSTNTLKDYEIDIHDLCEQQHIVNILGSIDNKIENNDLLSQKYESLLKNLYLKYFSKNNIDLSNYTQYNLTDLANFTGGYSYKGSELVPSSYGLLTIKNFDRNTGFKLDGFKDLSQENKAKNNQYIDKFDIVVAHTDLTQNAEIIGNAEIVLNNSSYEKLVASMDLVIVRPKEVISNSLLYILLHNPDFKKHALGYCAGTTVLHLNKRALNKYVVYIPKDKNIKNQLEDIVDKIIKKQASLIEQNIILNKLKSLYLKKFFR